MTVRKKSLMNMGSAIVGQVLAVIIGFALPRLLITNFGSSVNGLLSSVNQILAYLALFEAGVGTVAMQALFAPVSRRDWAGVNGVLSATNRYYTRASTLYLAALVILAALYPLVVAVELPYLSVSLVILFCGLPSVISFRVQAKYVLFLRADGKNYIVNNLTTLITVLVGAAKVILILLGFNVVWVMFASFLIHLIQSVYIIGYIRRRHPELSAFETPDYQSISQKNYMLVHQISNLVFQNTDVVILTAVMGLKVVSVYSIYKLVMTQLSNLLQIMHSSVDFVLGQTYQADLALYTRRIDRLETYYSALSFAVYAVLNFLMFSFVKIYTSGVTDIVYADQWLVILFVLIELLNIMRLPMLHTINYAGHFKKTTPQSVLESVLNLGISLLAVQRFGMYGVLVGTAVALLYRTNDIIIYSNTKLLKRSPVKTYLIHAMNIAMFLLLQWLFPRLFSASDNYLSLVITGILAGLISAVLFLGMQTLVWRDNRAMAAAFAGRLGQRIKPR